MIGRYFAHCHSKAANYVSNGLIAFNVPDIYANGRGLGTKFPQQVSITLWTRVGNRIVFHTRVGLYLFPLLKVHKFFGKQVLPQYVASIPITPHVKVLNVHSSIRSKDKLVLYATIQCDFGGLPKSVPQFSQVTNITSPWHQRFVCVC